MSFFYIILFLILGVILLFLELFVPGGIVGLIGVILMGMAVYICFDQYGAHTGFIVLLVSVVITLSSVIIIFYIFPRTREGRWFILSDSLTKGKGYHSDAYADKALIGREGYTESELRPAGIAVIGEQRYDVVTEGDFIEPKQRIRVLRVDGNRIVVERFQG